MLIVDWENLHCSLPKQSRNMNSVFRCWDDDVRMINWKHVCTYAVQKRKCSMFTYHVVVLHDCASSSVAPLFCGRFDLLIKLVCGSDFLRLRLKHSSQDDDDVCGIWDEKKTLFYDLCSHTNGIAHNMHGIMGVEHRIGETLPSEIWNFSLKLGPSSALQTMAESSGSGTLCRYCCGCIANDECSHETVMSRRLLSPASVASVDLIHRMLTAILCSVPCLRILFA